MNSRERIRAALRFKESDRLPLDLGSTFTTGICLTAYRRLVTYLGLPDRDYFITDPMQMLCRIDDDILEKLGIDVVGINPPVSSFGTPNRDYVEWQVTPEFSCRIPSSLNLRKRLEGGWEFTPEGSDRPSAVMPEGQMFFDLLSRSEKVDLEKLTPEAAREEAGRSFSLLTDCDLDYYEKESWRLYNQTDRGIIANLNICALGGYLRIVSPEKAVVTGIGKPELWYIALLLNEPYIREIFDRQSNTAIENLKLLHEALGNRIDAIMVSGADFGTQNGLLISGDIFRSLYKPYYTRVNNWIHTHTHWKTFFHSCGSLIDILDDFVEMGVDILNPVQFTASGMDLDALKKRYTGKLVFWGGGVDTQSTFPNGKKENVVEEVQHNIDILGQGGGFVFTPVHNIQADVPPQNIIAAYQCAAGHTGQFKE